MLLVPGISADATDPGRTADAYRRFELFHTWLGTILGETIGYALTATFTVLVAYALTRGLAPRWMTYLGYVSAALIATGIVIPFGVEAAEPEQLRRLHRLVPLAHRSGRRAVARRAQRAPIWLERRAGRQVGRSAAPLRWTRSALTFQSRTAAARS